MKLIHKLMLGFLMVALMVGTVGSVSLYQLFHIAEPLNKDMPRIIELIKESAHLDELAQSIRYYDEVLTQSARNYAFTQNNKWKERYQDIEPKLDKVINEAIKKGDEKDRKFFSSVNEANIALVKMEYKSIEFVDNGHNEEAIKILDSTEYGRQKKVYEQGLKRYVNKRGVQYTKVLDTSTDKINLLNNHTHALLVKSIQFVSIFLAICVILTIWIEVSVFNSISKPLIKLRVAATKIGKGELNTNIDIDSKDEIGQLAKSFQKMTNDLKTTTVSRDELINEIKMRKRSDKMHHDSEERFRAVAESANDAIIYIDSRREIIFWNKASEIIFGYSADEIVGKLVALIIPERFRKAHKIGIDGALKSDKLRNHGKAAELIGLKKDGSEFPCEISLSTWKAGNETFFTAVIRDITDRKQADAVIKNQVSRLSALRAIDKAIIGSLDLDVTLDVLLTHVKSELKIDAASVLLYNQDTQMLEYKASTGFQTNALKYTRLRMGESYAGRAALERNSINIPNLNEESSGFEHSHLFFNEGFISYFAIPLVAKGSILGVIEIFHRSQLDIEPEWIEFLESIATQGALALDNSFLFNNLQSSNVGLALAYDRTLEGWSRALDMRDKETEGHSQRVTEMTVRIAQEFQIKGEELLHIRRGALLHDIGKMGIPDSILLKPGKLTEEEWTIMKLHPIYARDLLYPIEFLRPAIDIPFSHHEKWDGTGYPVGLKGENIPLSARIFAVVDVWDALRSDRPYRPAWSREKTIEHIRSLIGTHFDAGVLEIFIPMVMQEEEVEVGA